MHSAEVSVVRVGDLVEVMHHFVRYDELVLDHLALFDFVQDDGLVGVYVGGFKGGQSDGGWPRWGALSVGEGVAGFRHPSCV